VSTHHDECPEAILECESCGTLYQRKDKETHNCFSSLKTAVHELQEQAKENEAKVTDLQNLVTTYEIRFMQ